MKHKRFLHKLGTILSYILLVLAVLYIIDGKEINSGPTQSSFLSNIKIVHKNACEFKSKIYYFNELSDCDLKGISERHLDSTISDKEGN